MRENHHIGCCNLSIFLLLNWDVVTKWSIFMHSNLPSCLYDKMELARSGILLHNSEWVYKPNKLDPLGIGFSCGMMSIFVFLLVYWLIALLLANKVTFEIFRNVDIAWETLVCVAIFDMGKDEDDEANKCREFREFSMRIMHGQGAWSSEMWHSEKSAGCFRRWFP